MPATEKECEALASHLRRKLKDKIVSFDVLESETGWMISVVSQENASVISRDILSAMVPSNWFVEGFEGAESRGNVYMVVKEP